MHSHSGTKQKFRLGIALLLLTLAVLACGFGGKPPIPEASPTPITPTRTPWPTQAPPTATETPTPHGLVPATKKPTLRPSWTPIPTNTWRPTWTASPTLSPTATSPVGILLEESFDDPLTPWMKTSGGNWATGIARKMYFMIVSAPKVEITSARTWIKLADVRIEADITQENGEGYYGFNCRESAGGNYYTIFVTTDGHYGFGHNINNELHILEYWELPELDPPIDPKGTNHIRADCRGNALTLFINGVPIDRTTVDGLGPGYVGMMIGTRSEDTRRFVVFYDNLVIYAPVNTPLPTVTPWPTRTPTGSATATITLTITPLPTLTKIPTQPPPPSVTPTP